MAVMFGANFTLTGAGEPRLVPGERVTGRFFANSKPKRSSQRSYDRHTAERLWQVSAQLVAP